jgi:tetrahydromethanopterin S-methyltransferase subunit G
MDYGVIAYTAAVSLAKKVVAQQHEIDDLKQRLERLERIIDRVTK